MGTSELHVPVFAVNPSPSRTVPVSVGSASLEGAGGAATVALTAVVSTARP